MTRSNDIDADLCEGARAQVNPLMLYINAKAR